MKTIFLTIFVATNSLYSAQITKGFWLIGGDGSLSYSNDVRTSNFDNIESTYNVGVIELSPNIGLFFIDKLAVGISGNYKQTFSKNEKSYYDISISTFLKYYLLPSDNSFNFFTQASYKFYFNNQSTIGWKSYKLKIGGVLFVNNIVGYEFSIEYDRTKFNNIFGNYGKTNMLTFGVGIQIHLEKN